MKNIFKDLWLSVLLIAAASAVLLLSDLEQRKSNVKQAGKTLPTIAIMQISSTPLLDKHVEGIIDGLKEGGMLGGDFHNLKKYNALGDLSVANAIAREIVNSPVDIVITSSTLALQTFAKANMQRQKTHVFGAVTDPYGAGVGIVGNQAANHPPYLCGIGTFQPVEKAFRIAKEMNPKLRKVGVVWNPGEQCSEACLLQAREICKEIGVMLIEAVAVNTSEVSEAVRSLTSKGVDAIWIGGDTVATASARMIFSIAAQFRIPVFTNDPADAAAGALFGLGADYYTVGKITAQLALEVLNGRPPSTVMIDNVVPEKLELNDSLMRVYARVWTPGAMVKSLLEGDENADQTSRQTVDFKDYIQKGSLPSTAQLLSAEHFTNLHLKRQGPAKVAVITLVENRLLEEAVRGVEEGMKWSGLQPGIDYKLQSYSAQGEIAQLPQIIDAVIRENPDVIVSVTTPAMMAIAAKVKEIPVVLTVTSNPIRLRVFNNGRPENICGVHDNPPLNELVQMALDYDTSLENFGIVYDPSQMNAVLSVETLREVMKQRKLRLFEATASNVTELGLATQALIQRGAKAIVVSADNLVNTGFSAIHKVAQPAGIPIFATEPQLVEQGATGALGDSFIDWGTQSGKLVAKVLAGVSPKDLPLSETEKHRRINPTQRAIGIQKIPFKLRIVQYSETEFAERCHDGLIDGINKSGLMEGSDYELKTLNAQGDMTTLSSIMSTVKADRVDMLMVISTPSLQAALRQAGEDTRIVFTGVGDAVKAGAGKSETDHLPNVTGITTRSPFDGMAKLIKQTMPACKKAGTLFTPAEINSVLYKDWFKEELKKLDIELVAIPVTSSADVVQSATELCRQDIQLVAQIVDNLTRPGFALIARKAAENNLPVYVFDSDQMPNGGAICLARDYYDAGLEAAEKALKVLNGTSPRDIPFSNTKSEKLMLNPKLVEQYQLIIPDDLKSKALIYNEKQ